MDPSQLDALRQRIGGIKLRGGADYWRPQEGPNRIRILPSPYVPDPDQPQDPEDRRGAFFAEVGKHTAPDEKTSWNCPSFTLSRGDPCPICEVVDKLARSGNKADKALADKLRLKKSFLMWIIDRNEEAELGKRGKVAMPRLFAAGTTIFGKIVAMVNDPDYGDITDIESGYDLTITREGKGRDDTKYETMPRPKTSALTDSQETFDEWMAKIEDLATSGYVNVPTEEELLEAVSTFIEEAQAEEQPKRSQPLGRQLRQATPAPQPVSEPSGSAPTLKRTVLRRPAE